MRISDWSSDVCSSDLLAAEEGDVRFYEARMKQARPMMDAISQQVERAQAAGRTPAHLSSRSCAGTVLMILERLSAIGPMRSHSDGVGDADLKESAAPSRSMMRRCGRAPGRESGRTDG